jgi:putative ABC transport system permease protein
METVWQDVKYGVRMLVKSPGFSAIAVLTLALGIGANTAIFSYVNAWLIKPLPYPHADRLMVFLWHNTKKGLTNPGVTSTADFVDYQNENKTFENIAGWTSWYFNLTGDGPPDRVIGGLVTWNFFQTLGVHPILGRAFVEQESQPASSHVAILSRGLWESRFGADPNVVGRKITLQNETYTVVGVMPAGFQFPLMGISNIWAPLALDDEQRNDRNTSWFSAFGRLRPGGTKEAANAELATLESRNEKLYPMTNANQTMTLSSMIYEIGQNEGTTQVMICFWIVGLVLLIACANVANLMLARTSRRTKEFAVRGALGASRARIVRQLLTESMLLFSVGGASGVLFGIWGIHWIEDAIPGKIRGYLVNYGHADLDVTTLLYTLGIVLFCGIIFGLAPAFESSGLDIHRGLKEASAQLSGSRRGSRLRRVFVAGEIALAMVVLVTTVLLVESFAHIVWDDLGFRAKDLLMTQLVVPPTKYSSETQIRNFYDQVLTRIRALPEVVSADASQYVPFGESNQVLVVHLAGHPPAQPGEQIGADYSAVTPGYFSAMQMGLIRGRSIEPKDGPEAPNVVVINDVLMRQQFQNEDPIGKQLEVGEKRTPYTIVGVVHMVKHYLMTDRPARQIYVSAAQFPSANMSLVVRASGSSPQLASEIRNAVWAVDGEQPVATVRPLDDIITEQNTGNRILTQMVAFFGALAMLLGAIGIYGVMAQSVEQRRRELGIRMALGASPREVTRMILGHGLRLAGVGIVFGVIAAAGATQALGSILYKVKASDPLTFISVAAFFTLVALGACWIPARRSARVDPMIALRYE